MYVMVPLETVYALFPMEVAFGICVVGNEKMCPAGNQSFFVKR